MMLVAIGLVIPQPMRLSGTVMEIWLFKDNEDTTLTFWGHMTSSVIRLPGFDMRLSSTVMEIRPFELLPGRLFQEQRSVVGRSSVGRSSILH